MIAFVAHPRYALIVAANRDEFHARPTAPSAWWDEGFLAGRDLQGGGTWLGVDRRGRFALLTNVRDRSRHNPGAPSRGVFVPNVLMADAPPSVSLPAQVRAGAAHNGFNLVAGSGDELLWGSNRAAAPRSLSAGIYGVSNHLLDTPWPKVERTKAALGRWCSSPGADKTASLLDVLHDAEPAADDALPATGVSLERERMLSAPFIIGADYGTRCSTVLTITREGNAHWIERTFDPAGNTTGEVEHHFATAEIEHRFEVAEATPVSADHSR